MQARLIVVVFSQYYCTNIESLHCTLETTIMLKVNYTSIKKDVSNGVCCLQLDNE